MFHFLFYFTDIILFKTASSCVWSLSGKHVTQSLNRIKHSLLHSESKSRSREIGELLWLWRSHVDSEIVDRKTLQSINRYQYITPGLNSLYALVYKHSYHWCLWMGLNNITLVYMLPAGYSNWIEALGKNCLWTRFGVGHYLKNITWRRKSILCSE